MNKELNIQQSLTIKEKENFNIYYEGNLDQNSTDRQRRNVVKRHPLVG